MITETQLLELIAIGENSAIEFKVDDLRPEQLAKEIVAFANFQGGYILLGVDDDGTIVGIKRKNLERWVMDTVFGRYVHPAIIPFYQEIKIDDKRRVASISVSQGISKPYVVRYRGREVVYIRSGSTSRLATREQQARLYAMGGMLHAELLPVSGSEFSDFSHDRLKDYTSSIVGEKTIPSNNAEWCSFLCRLGFMTETEYGPEVGTIAGLALFGNAPRRVLGQMGIRWMAFEGKEKGYSALDDRVINGPLVALRKSTAHSGAFVVENGIIENLMDAMRPFISEECGKVDDSMRRERIWHYPVEAIREAVINAVAHRDWTRNEEIEVVRYEDRLEILSPGPLLNSMTVEKMITGQRSPRNTLIVSVLRDYGYVDARGMGVRNKIIPLLQEYNGTVPEFEATEDYLKVVMYRS